MSYLPVALDADDKADALDSQDEDNALLSADTLKQTVPDNKWKIFRWCSGRLLCLVPWCLNVSLTAVLLAVLITRDECSHQYGTYEKGFHTDLSIPIHIPMEQIRFTRSPLFTANGTGFLEPVNESMPWPEKMDLFGKPNPIIDRNWFSLIGNRYFSISEDEAERAWGERRHEYIDQALGGYTAGLEVFHTLHCVNMIRKAVHSDYYKQPHQSHIEHCLDAIRQTIQCYGSTTLIPTTFREGLNEGYIDSNQIHTCRSFTALREFVDSRRVNESAFVYRDQSLLDKKKHALAVEHGIYIEPKRPKIL